MMYGGGGIPIIWNLNDSPGGGGGAGDRRHSVVVDSICKVDFSPFAVAGANNGQQTTLHYLMCHDGCYDPEVLQTKCTLKRLVQLQCSSYHRELIALDEHFNLCRIDFLDNNSDHSVVGQLRTEVGDLATAAALSPNGETLAVAIHQCDKPIKRSENSKGSQSPSDDPRNFQIQFFDFRKLKDPFQSYSESHSDCIRTLDFSEDVPNLLISGGDDNLVNFFDSSLNDEDEALLFTNQMESSVINSGFLTNSRAYASTHDNRFSIFQCDSTENCDVISKNKRQNDKFLVDLVDCVRTDSFLAVESDPQGESIVTYISNDGKKMSTIYAGHNHRDLIRCCAYDLSWRLLLTGGDDGRVAIRQLSLPEKSMISSKKSARTSKPYSRN